MRVFCSPDWSRIYALHSTHALELTTSINSNWSLKVIYSRYDIIMWRKKTARDKQLQLMLVHWLHNRIHVHSRRLISFQTVLCYFRFDVLWNAEIFSVLCNYATCNTPGFSFSRLLRNVLKSGNVTCNRDIRNTSLSRPGDIFSLSYLESCTEERPSNCCSWQNRLNCTLRMHQQQLDSRADLSSPALC